MISLLIVTAVRLYREGLEQVLLGDQNLEVVGSVGSVEEALDRTASARPDVILLDVPVDYARVVVQALHDRHPRGHVVVFGIREVADEVLPWAEAGASGYVSSESSISQLVATVLSVARGDQPCSAAIAGALLRRVGRLAATAPPDASTASLTRREVEIADLIERGLTNKEIGRALGISLPTVKNHVHNIYEKLGVHRRAQALARLGRSYRVEAHDHAERSRI